MFGLKRKRATMPLNPVRLVTLGFLAIILIGTLLLSLPVAYKGQPIGFINTVFTATSATCVTGLIVVDTATHWTLFGQIVLLLLIQVGGLGFMSIVTLFSFMARRTITLRERMVMREMLNSSALQGIVRLTRRVIFGTLMIEGVGALLLSVVFVPQYGFVGGIWRAIFHSVSAFCNAGFDILGEGMPFCNLMPYSGNVLLVLTISALIIIGGLGFFVWGDIVKRRHSVHTKIVLIMTGTLLLGGTVLFFAFEHRNPLTMGNMLPGEQWLSAFFQSVTTRTAGFNTVDNGALTVPSKFISVIWMLIGGSPGSTAGGMKTVTLAVVLLSVRATLKNAKDVNVFGRRIARPLVMRALTVLCIAFALVFGGVLCLSIFEQKPFIDLLFEVASAFGTVGLGTGITPFLSVYSKCALVILMFTGRVGIMTLAVAMQMRGENTVAVRYPEEDIMIG